MGYTEELAERQKVNNKIMGELNLKLDKAFSILGFKRKPNDEKPFERISSKYINGDMSLYVSTSGYEKWKIRISGDYPRNWKNEYIRPYDYNEKASDSINVSHEKTADQIAKDIERRLMPEYKIRLAKVQKLNKSSNDYQNNSIKLLEELKGFPADKYETENRKFSLHMETGFCSIDVHGNEVSLDIHSVSGETAKKIIAILKEK
jgi:hypothetical protein